MRWLLVCAALAGACKQQERAAPPEEQNRPLPLPAAEVKRGQDACQAYVDAVCRCAATVPRLEQACKLSRSLPEAIRVSTEVGMSPDSTRNDIAHARDMLRKTVANCIEQTAKLPSEGCP